MVHGGRGGQQDAHFDCKYLSICHTAHCVSGECQLTSLLDAPDPFGYTYSEHDPSHDTSGPSLMNDKQQSYMDDFFAHPDLASTNDNENDVIPFNFAGFDLNDRSGGMSALGLQMPSNMPYNFGIGGGNIHVPVPVSSTPRTGNHMSMPQLSQYDASKGFDSFINGNDQNSASHTQDHITHDDQAASALMSMSSHSQEHLQPTAASWGNINMSDSSGFDELHSPAVSGGPSSGSTNTPLTPSYNNTFQRLGRASSHAQYLPQNFVQQTTQPAGYAHTRHPSLQIGSSNHNPFTNQLYAWHMPQSPMGQDQSQRRQPLVQYGSDQNFGQERYQASTYPTSDDKYSNLLNVPGAGQVAHDSHASASVGQQTGGMRIYGHQQRHSVPSNLQQLSNAALSHQMATLHTASPTLQQHGNQFSPVHAMENIVGTQQSRKRRRSQDEIDEAPSFVQAPRSHANGPRRAPVKQETTDEHQPDTYATPPGSPKKRRKSRPSTASPTASASPSTPAQSTGKASSSTKKKSSGQKQPRNNLSDAQKRDNHIASEQKRRDAMKNNYGDLNTLVPTLQNGQHGMSRSEVLQHSADYLEALQLGNAAIMSAYGLTIDDLSEELAQLDAEEAAREAAAAASNNRS